MFRVVRAPLSSMNCSINPRVSAPNSCTRVRGFNRAVSLYSNSASEFRLPRQSEVNLQVQRKLNMQRQSRATRGFKTGQTILLQTQENADEILLFLPLAPPGAPPASCSTSGEGASTASALHDGPRRSLTPNCHSRSSHPGVCSEQAAGAEELPLIRKTKLRRAAL